MATWHLGYHLSICSWTRENQEKPASRWPVAGPSGPCPLDSVNLKMVLPLCHVVRELCGVSSARDARVDKPKASPSPSTCESEINPFSNRQCHDSLSIYLDNRVVDIQIY